MPNYHRAFVPGGTFFFTVVTEDRARILCHDQARSILRRSIEQCRDSYPFEIDAFVLLPDHLHTIWTLPDGDANFSRRWAAIKARFSSAWIESGGGEKDRSESRLRNRRRGVWQRRFWEHLIRDLEDLNRHLDYIHYNPVKHGLASCSHVWPYSSFHRWVRGDGYEAEWQCVCGGRKSEPPKFEGMEAVE